MSEYYVYILSNASGTLYIGMTNNLERRMYEHKNKLVPGFTQQYNLTRLVYFETAPRPIDAIEREKQLKNWRREKKVKLIESMNPEWKDLAADWYSDT